MFEIVFTRRFAMAHRLLADRSSKCATPHGHNAFVKATLTARDDPEFGGSNLAAPFDRLKKRWHGFIDGSVDHCFMVGEEDPLIGYFLTHEPDVAARLMVFAGDPTTEAMCLAFYHKLSAFLAEDGLAFDCTRIEVEETPTNTVSLDATRLSAAAKAFLPGAWCGRADMSINDLALPIPFKARREA